jgi:lipid II:glycine glycyltransferase (peptidoglycan interpeptide bridge formation enzyme)
LNGQPLPDVALQSLYSWAKRNHYVFLRFTHSDAGLLDRIAEMCPSERRDGFPLYRDTGAADHELVVNQLRDEKEMLAGFDREARRKIRRANEVGYRVESDDTPEFLESVWPLFISCAKRKGFELYRSTDAYLEIVRLARPYKCVRIYTANLNDVPVEALFIIRDRSTAFCYLAALQLDRLQGKATPSVLLHWRAMRDLYNEGCRYYSFGPGEGGVGQFKMQFSPQRVTYPPPLTVIVNQPIYRAWSAVKPGLVSVWPTLKLLIAKTIQ